MLIPLFDRMEQLKTYESSNVVAVVSSSFLLDVVQRQWIFGCQCSDIADWSHL